MRDVLGSIPAVLKQFDVDGVAVEPVVFAAWRRCVDGVLLDNVVPVRMEGNRLMAAVPSETWKRNVADLGPALAARINEAAGSQLVKFIEFYVDADAVREHRDARTTGRIQLSDEALNEQLSPELMDAVESISDRGLREIFVAAAAGSLARRKMDARKRSTDD